MIKPISDLMHKSIAHKNVVINLWSDKDRPLDIVGGLDLKCVHLRSSLNRCDSCGSYVGHIGKERDPLLYYKHVDLLSNSFTDSDNVYIVSDRYYPEDYTLPAFGMALGNYKGWKYKRVYTLYDKVNPNIHTSSGRAKVKYIIHYTNDRTKLWNNTFVHMRDLHPSYLLAENDTLCVNPTKKDFRISNPLFTFFIPNSSILVLVNDSIIKDRIKTLQV